MTFATNFLLDFLLAGVGAGVDADDVSSLSDSELLLSSWCGGSDSFCFTISPGEF